MLKFTLGLLLCYFWAVTLLFLPRPLDLIVALAGIAVAWLYVSAPPFKPSRFHAIAKKIFYY